MKLSSLPQFSRNTKRFTEIVSILGKYGLANWISESDPDFLKGLFKSADGVNLSELTENVRIRLALTELGPTFIKLGQILSTRADLAGPELADELVKLQSDTPADPPEAVRATIEEELGASADIVFAEFEDRAMASASIGQVHRATLHSGEHVVVKVQHEGIAETVATDLDILLALAELAEMYDPSLRVYQPKSTVAEFRRNLLRELDFTRERRNLEQFSRNFATEKMIHIPNAYPEFSARRVLTMEKLEGVTVANVDVLKQEGIDTKALSVRGADMYINMIFRDRFFHADPHPGNIWVLEGGVLGLLDCGMVGRIDAYTCEEVEGMLLAAIERDANQLTEFVIRIGSMPEGLNRHALRVDIDEFVSEYIGQSLQDFDLSGVVDGLTGIVRQHHILLPPGLASLLKVLVMLEGTSRSLNRDFSLVELLKPYYANAMQRKFSPERLINRLKHSYRDWERLLNMLPYELTEILSRVRDGKFTIYLDHRRLDAIVNRLVYGLLTAALFVGSSLIVKQQIPPTFKEVSVFGAAGCLTALVLGFNLLRAIKKSGDLGQK